MRGLAATTCAALVAHAAVQPAGGTPPAPVLEGNASGVFLNDAGDVLTARHAVTGCRSLFVLKDGRVAEATVRATSPQPELDIAVLRSDIKPYLGATFPRGEALPAATISVFSEAHGPLQRMADRSAVLGNALTVPGAEGLQLLSGAKPGASGSAVLDAGGLLLGVVVERIAAAPGASGGTLSRPPSLSGSGAAAGSTRVRAETAARIKHFLRDNGVAFSESDTPQLGPRQSPAARAATLSVGVLCG